ncbi:MAG TPA: SusC/RagA family TonB-linked outer membrane protein, partial [Segetibacter sp.]|nr:SusC/RagA family TonB-linked outer membrane protein [Segetibacter sp.]
MKGLAKRSLQKLTIAICWILIAVVPVAAQQRVNVTGKVTGETGDPISGASITVRGTQSGTTTREDGNFSISVPVNSSIVISAVGFAEQVLKVTSQTTALNVKLQASNTALEQVVVVGYGTQRKEAVTGSVATIGGERLREVPSPNITQALQGRLAGVDISQTSTRPGATMQIRIRGTRSLSADNNPLIVLDGIPFIGSLADINPNDIKSVDVLKDASATAIYGSRGANGVILVTTDKGGKNRKPRISYNAYHGIQNIFAKYPMMNGPQFVALRKVAKQLPGGQYPNGQDEADSINTDWQDLLYRTGFISDHNISLAGGSETGNYNFGGGYYINQGIIPTQQYKRYSFRASIDQQVGKYVRVGFSTNNNYNQNQGGQ